MKFVSLISSGIDSPVATYLLSKKAEELILVHADGIPFTDNREIDNFVLIAKHLKKQICCDIKTYVVPHGKTLYSFKKNCDEKFTCVFCKRMLLRYAEKIAMSEEADGIIMGDSLGQVASQTLQNIRAIEQSINFPILRPLIGFDKEDIIKIAKEIGAYDLSILPSDSCSAVPHKPSTKAKLEKIVECEEKINVGKLVDHTVNNLEIVLL